LLEFSLNIKKNKNKYSRLKEVDFPLKLNQTNEIIQDKKPKKAVVFGLSSFFKTDRANKKYFQIFKNFYFKIRKNSNGCSSVVFYFSWVM
jgi:hypothetical protein